MQSKPKLPRPTDGELEILNVLWDRGPSTVRDVHAAICRAKPAQYTPFSFLILAIPGKLKFVERLQSGLGNKNRGITWMAISRMLGDSPARGLFIDIMPKVGIEPTIP